LEVARLIDILAAASRQFRQQEIERLNETDGIALGLLRSQHRQLI
jgi:hypothetical protein